MKKRVFVVTALAAMMLVSACGKKNEIVEKAAAAKEVASVVFIISE